MPPNKLFLNVDVKMKVDITKKSIRWWMKPKAWIDLELIRLGCWLSGAEVTVHEQPSDWNKKTPEVNIDAFMRP